MVDRDNFYKVSLHSLQNKLHTLQEGNNDEYIQLKTNAEINRDSELTRLRLWEEYQVKRCENEYKADLMLAKEHHDKMIKLLKEKLYDKLSNEITQLKEDKLLLNLVNANSWTSNSQDPSTIALNAIAGSALNDRRSLRKREFHRFTTGEADDLSDGGTSTAGYLSANGKRRRHYTTRYSSNDEMSSTVSGQAHPANHPHLKLNQEYGGLSSGNDSNLSDKDYDALNTIIMNNDDGGMSIIIHDKSQIGTRSARGSAKHFIGVQGLKPDELNDDLTLLRNAIVKKEK